MKAVIQRVLSAKVEVEGQVRGEIGRGLLTFIGFGAEDREEMLLPFISKILKLRIFEDEQGKMNRSLLEVSGEHLLVSQFTLYGDCSKGNRPSFMSAASPDQARELYQKGLEISRSLGVVTAAGQFQADMKVTLLNDGPVTLVLES